MSSKRCRDDAYMCFPLLVEYGEPNIRSMIVFYLETSFFAAVS
jgi:hypothetical protein